MRTPRTPADRLRAYVARYPSKAAAARAMGVSKQFLGQAVKGRVSISPKLLAYLGLERRVRVVAVKKQRVVA